MKRTEEEQYSCTPDLKSAKQGSYRVVGEATDSSQVFLEDLLFAKSSHMGSLGNERLSLACCHESGLILEGGREVYSLPGELSRGRSDHTPSWGLLPGTAVASEPPPSHWILKVPASVYGLTYTLHANWDLCHLLRTTSGACSAWKSFATFSECQRESKQLFGCWSKCFLLGEEACGTQMPCSVDVARARLVSHLHSVTQIRFFRSIRKTRLRQAKVLVYDHTAQLQRSAGPTCKFSSRASAQDGYLLVPMRCLLKEQAMTSSPLYL